MGTQKLYGHLPDAFWSMAGFSVTHSGEGFKMGKEKTVIGARSPFLDPLWSFFALLPCNYIMTTSIHTPVSAVSYNEKQGEVMTW